MTLRSGNKYTRVTEQTLLCSACGEVPTTSPCSIQCDNCKKIYHPSCLGNEAPADNEPWSCKLCAAPIVSKVSELTVSQVIKTARTLSYQIPPDEDAASEVDDTFVEVTDTTPEIGDELERTQIIGQAASPLSISQALRNTRQCFKEHHPRQPPPSLSTFTVQAVNTTQSGQLDVNTLNPSEDVAPSRGDKGELYVCGVCSNIAEEATIECDGCDKWFHAKCVLI